MSSPGPATTLRGAGKAALVAAAIALFAACGADPAPAGESPPLVALEPTASPGPTPTATAVTEPTSVPFPDTPTPAPTATETAAEYDPDDNMFLLFSGRGHPFGDTLDALARARENDDRSQVPVIIEMLRFFPVRDLWTEAAVTLTALTGQNFGTNFRDSDKWMEWLGRNLSDFQPPGRYLDWKINLLSTIDPRYIDFLSGADKTTRIELPELVWGGVPPDGIPDLLNPPHVAADEQDYLLPDDRVFGVSINGEHRAYPLRIVNAHEMANDVLGGEPIALAY